jgi:hypothetical protein
MEKWRKRTSSMCSIFACRNREGPEEWLRKSFGTSSKGWNSL